MRNLFPETKSALKYRELHKMGICTQCKKEKTKDDAWCCPKCQALHRALSKDWYKRNKEYKLTYSKNRYKTQKGISPLISGGVVSLNKRG